MDNQSPTHPRKSRKPQPPSNEVETPKEQPPAVMKPSKIGEPTIGRSPDYVKTVGLGNLTVITANGKRTNPEPA